MLIHVAGVDPATRNLAVAHPDGRLVTLNARAGSKDAVRRLFELERAFVSSISHHPPLPDVFVIEGYGLGSPGRLALVRLGEVGGMVRGHAFRLAAHVVEVAPSALKRFATGNGTATKGAMIERAVELGARFSRPITGDEKKDPHDEADAFLARHLGRVGYGLSHVAPVAHELEVASAISWPKVSR